MYRLEIKTTGVPPAELDVPAIEEAMAAAARATMRVRGGRRGENLRGVAAAVRAAAEAEIERQLEEGADR